MLNFVNGAEHVSSEPHHQLPGLIKSRINQRNTKDKSFNNSQTRQLVPPPNPKDSVGEYFDKYATVLDEESNSTQITSEVPESELTGRGIDRGTGYLGTVWTGSEESYNISLSRCIVFSDIAGTWTNTNGTTTPNATLEHINSDLRTKYTGAADLSHHLKSRLLDNALHAIAEAEAFLNSTVCPSNQSEQLPASTTSLPKPQGSIATIEETSIPDITDLSVPDMTHDELRKLLVTNTDVTHSLNSNFLDIDGYWTSVLMSMTAGAGIGGALYKGFYSHNATSENVAIVCFTAAGLILVRGVVERLYMTGLLKFIEASIISAFTSWFRQAVDAVASIPSNLRQIGSDNHISGCLEEIVIDKGMDSLPTFQRPQAGVIEVIPMGGVCT